MHASVMCAVLALNSCAEDNTIMSGLEEIWWGWWYLAEIHTLHSSRPQCGTDRW